MAISLRGIKHCFDGAMPSGIASCSSDGVTNVTYVSQAHYIDDDHVGLSWQFFNKTKVNIAGNPQTCLLLIDPSSGVQYRLDMSYETTETEGDIFDKLKIKLDAVASMSGMSDVFHLRGVDIYRVTKWECMEEDAVSEAPQSVTSFQELNKITQTISECDQLSTLLDTTLSQLHDRLGYSNSMVLLPNPDGQSLYIIASNGYEKQGAGAEVKFGEGIIGTVAMQCKPVKINNMQRENIMADAVRLQANNDKNEFALEARIALPGLSQPNSQLAVPIEAKRKLLGVLFIESEENLNFTGDTQEFVGSIANHLGTAMLLCDDEPATRSEPTIEAINSDKVLLQGEAIKVRHYRADNSVFIANDYLIKGVAGAILWRLLQIYKEQGRSEFTNRELRLDSNLGLPDIVDNLEARLVLLLRRLDDRCSYIKMEKTGRGRFQLLFTRPLDLMSVASL